MLTGTCPSVDRWQEHLRGALPPGEEAELSAHLDGCRACQQVLEGLAARPDSLLDVARAVGQEPRTEETALRQAMGALHGTDTDVTQTQNLTPNEGGTPNVRTSDRSSSLHRPRALGGGQLA